MKNMKKRKLMFKIKKNYNEFQFNFIEKFSLSLGFKKNKSKKENQ